MNAQTIVAANVAARGYMAGWTREQFVARQLCKMTEELAEAARQITPSTYEHRRLGDWLEALQDAGIAARLAFDERSEWTGLIHISRLAPSELADMQVVLFAAAQALDFDIVQAAIDKSSQDVARGVR